MKRTLLFSLFCCFFQTHLHAQITVDSTQITPKKVMEAIFKAAQTKDFSVLSKLCPPDGRGDGDVKYLCRLPKLTEKDKQDFVSYFVKGYIRGDISYSTDENGDENASIPFWFNHPAGESRSNETMNMIKIEGLWYLLSF